MLHKINTLVSIGYVRHSYMSPTFAHTEALNCIMLGCCLILPHAEHAVTMHDELVLTSILACPHKAPQMRAHISGLM